MSTQPSRLGAFRFWVVINVEFSRPLAATAYETGGIDWWINDISLWRWKGQESWPQELDLGNDKPANPIESVFQDMRARKDSNGLLFGRNIDRVV
jgi:hypothetical protein